MEHASIPRRLGPLVAAAWIGVLRMMGADGEIPFRTGLLPLLTKAGCNAGACHGAATGQGGLHLSLLGYDPEADHQTLTRSRGGRFIDRLNPAESLILRKPSRQLEHEGGRRLGRDSEAYERVRQWIAAGAPYGPRDRRVTAIMVTPAESQLTPTNGPIRLRVEATISDGSREDVTALALYSSNDEAVAGVEGTGAVRVSGRGVTDIMVRYSGQVGVSRVVVPFSDTVPDGEKFPEDQPIDVHIGAALKRLGLPASPASSDGEFLRRVHLDLAGRLPTGAEARAFLDGPASPDRRQRVIDGLLESAEFVDLWTMWWADLLLVGGRRAGAESTQVYHGWLREQIARNTPYDQLARALLTARGPVASVGPANFFTLANDPRDLSEQVGRIFLGTRIGCARCHAHPADRWTQEDYHGFAACFARVTRDGGRIEVSARGEVDHPKTGERLAPRPLGGAELRDDADGDRRAGLAVWLTRPDHPLFARAIVNRIWKQLLGRGLVEPADDLRPTNPATHPVLLDTLATDFARQGYDLRRLIRTMVSSHTYQLSSRSRGLNRLDDRWLSHARVKELPAAVFLDVVGQVTGVPEVFPDQVAGTRAVQLVGARTPSYSLDVLGRCSRDTGCEGVGSAGGGLAQALHLINGSVVNGRLRAGVKSGGWASGATSREVIEELYLRAFTRRPEVAEFAEWESRLAGATDRSEAFEDLLWAVLNSREFAFNH